VGQHDFAIVLKILKRGDGVSQVLHDSFPHVACTLCRTTSRLIAVRPR
jgi:hypothetical protein